ncbi:MAG: peptide-methionine (S)-S-oxide reductase MsrA [Gammaproteobacteria bacterium]
MNARFLLLLLFGLLAASASVAAVSEPPSATTHVKTLVLGAGCFWGAEKGYEALDGVEDAVSGYGDGRTVPPNYEAISSLAHRRDPDNYAEVVEVRYNTEVLSTRALLQHFFEHHDPTQLNRQGNDVGTQYRSTILYTDEEQRATAQEVLDEYQKLLTAAGRGAIVTTIKPLETFHPAEDYHQDYLAKNPRGYCPDHSTGVRFAATTTPPPDNAALLRGKQVLVLEAEHCPFCARFRRDVTDAYAGSVPITHRRADQLKGLTLKTPTWATPTVYFLDNGKEVGGHQGYMSAAEFYRALGRFQLGDSDAFHVAFDKSTDRRFCRSYEKFKHTPDGVFIDKLSGAPLFDTRDRFDSGSGWLSFTRPVDGATVEQSDDSHDMQRTEVLSKSTGIHLGHVFDDGPDGKPRYCINATVLEFRARAD